MSALLRLSTHPVHPDRNDEYLFYQLLVGTWPADMLGDAQLQQADRTAFAERLKSVMTKSIREAKLHSTWTAPDEAYESAALGMIDEAIVGPASERFLAAVQPFAERIAELGARNSFAQTVLKFTVPGMPDIYQGAELWDLTMVDPDNRRPIDYVLRRAALTEVRLSLEADRMAAMQRLWLDWRSGRFKLALTQLLLRLRALKPELFASGDYQALTLTGARADRFCGFLRRHGETMLVVIAAIVASDADVDDVGFAHLPIDLAGLSGENAISGKSVTLRDGDKLPRLLAGLPAFAAVFRQPEAIRT